MPLCGDARTCLWRDRTKQRMNHPSQFSAKHTFPNNRGEAMASQINEQHAFCMALQRSKATSFGQLHSSVSQDWFRASHVLDPARERFFLTAQVGAPVTESAHTNDGICIRPLSFTVVVFTVQNAAKTMDKESRAEKHEGQSNKHASWMVFARLAEPPALGMHMTRCEWQLFLWNGSVLD